MRVAAYIHAHRTRNPTGVGKHIIHMTSALAAMSDVSLRLVLPRRASLYAESLARLDAVSLPASWKVMERLWTLTGRPRVERWTGAVDWVYCPAETYVPTRSAKLAATFHCVNWFERDLPWYDDAAIAARRRRLRIAWRPILRRAERLLVVSEFLGQRLVELFGVDASRLAVVGNGVEEAYFQAAAQQPKADRPYLLIVGGLTQRKGAQQVLAAARALESRWPELRLRVVGRSEAPYEQAAAARSNIEHLGYVGSDGGLPMLMRGATALLFLSRYETFGIPAVEAMAAGTVPIVSQHAALPPIVGDGGLVVNSADSDAVAEAVLKLRDDTALRQRLAVAARQRAQQFTWQACAQHLRAALNV